MAYSKIVLIGASGELGGPVLKRLVDSGKFEITVLARESSSYTSPYPSVKVQKLDLQNIEALTSALQGTDVVVMTIGFTDYENSAKAIINASIAAGVKRVIPSDYGTDNDNFRASTTIFAPKRSIDKLLAEKAAAGEIEYTTVFNGAFLDWSLKRFEWGGVDIPNRKMIIFDDGDTKVICTTLDSVGQAVVGVLSNPEATKNRSVRVHDFFNSQNELLAELEALTGTKWTIDRQDSDKVQAECLASLAQGMSLEAVQTYVRAHILGKNTSSTWDPNDDSELMEMPKKDMREELKKLL